MTLYRISRARAPPLGKKLQACADIWRQISKFQLSPSHQCRFTFELLLSMCQRNLYKQAGDTTNSQYSDQFPSYLSTLRGSSSTTILHISSSSTTSDFFRDYIYIHQLFKDYIRLLRGLHLLRGLCINSSRTTSDYFRDYIYFEDYTSTLQGLHQTTSETTSGTTSTSRSIHQLFKNYIRLLQGLHLLRGLYINGLDQHGIRDYGYRAGVRRHFALKKKAVQAKYRPGLSDNEKRDKASRYDIVLQTQPHIQCRCMSFIDPILFFVGTLHCMNKF